MCYSVLIKKMIDFHMRINKDHERIYQKSTLLCISVNSIPILYKRHWIKHFQILGVELN